jgi:hypothetical protein
VKKCLNLSVKCIYSKLQSQKHGNFYKIILNLEIRASGVLNL